MPQTLRRKRLNITVREDIIEDARAMDLNISEAAEAGLLAALRKAREEAWLRENADAIRAHNERVERDGLLLKPYWAEE